MSGPDGGRGDGPGSRGPDGPSQRSKTYKVLKTRKGFHTKLIEKVDKQVIENKVISKATVPYVRSKTITFKRVLGIKIQYSPFPQKVSTTTECENKYLPHVLPAK